MSVPIPTIHPYIATITPSPPLLPTSSSSSLPDLSTSFPFDSTLPFLLLPLNHLISPIFAPKLFKLDVELDLDIFDDVLELVRLVDECILERLCCVVVGSSDVIIEV